MIPQPVTDEMVKSFHEDNPESVKRTFVGPDDLPNVEPCEGVVHRSSDGVTAVVRVPMKLEEGELQALINGGTVWVTMWGGISPFAVEVVAPVDEGPKLHVAKASGPHSRACGLAVHAHGKLCHSLCPTCHGLGS
jgi:hypothetical protein